jgi:hypothetical protein
MQPNRRGFSLVEIVITMVLATVIFLGVVKAVHVGAKATISSQRQLKLDRALGLIQKRLTEAPYHQIFTLDSLAKGGASGVSGGVVNGTNLSLQWSTSPLNGMLLELEREVKAAGGNRLRVGVTYLLRDTADYDKDGRSDDLANWVWGFNMGTQNTTNDPNLAFRDLNNDGDLFDVVPVAGVLRPEVPDTPYKHVHLRIRDQQNNTIAKTRFLLTRDALSGRQGGTAASPLTLQTSLVACDAFTWYSTATPELKASWDLRTTFLYPNRYYFMNGVHQPSQSANCRVDDIAGIYSASIYYTVNGKTEPNATVELTTTTTPGPASFKESYVVGPDGRFSFNFPQFSSYLNTQEGRFWVFVRATKGGLASPYISHAAWPNGGPDVLTQALDRTPPQVVSVTPASGSTVRTRTPYVSYHAMDTTNRPVSYAGGYPGGTTMVKTTKLTGLVLVGNGLEMPRRASSYANVMATATVVLASTQNAPGQGLPYPLADETTYTFQAQVNDGVGYASTATWTVAVDLDPPGPGEYDLTPPNFAAVSTSNSTLVFLLDDPESGVNPYTITVSTILGPTNIHLSSMTPTFTSLGNAYDVATGSVTINGSFASGSYYQLQIHAEHWSATPAPLDTSWSFTIP